MYTKLVLLAIGIVALFVSGNNAADKSSCRDYKIEILFGNVTSYDDKMIGDTVIDVVEEDNDIGVFKLDGKMKIIKDIPDSAVIDMVIWEEKEGEWKEQTRKDDFKICEFLELYISIIRDIARKGNFPTTCPIKPKEITVDKYTVDACIFPPAMPRTQFRFLFSFKNDGKKLFDLFLETKIVDKE